jgi:hypothetical protein
MDVSLLPRNSDIKTRLGMGLTTAIGLGVAAVELFYVELLR